MPTIDLSTYHQPAGSGADGSKYDNALDLIQTTINGLDNNNFASGKIFDPAKLMQDSAADGDCLVWDNVNSKWVPATTRKMIAASISGYPADSTKFLNGLGGWTVPSGTGATTYRKVTSKTVNTSVAETDLLNGEITLAANPGTSAMFRITVFFDYLNNTGGAVTFRWRLKFGATTLWDSGALSYGTSTSRGVLAIEAKGMNLGVANAQAWKGEVITPASGFAGTGGWTTGEGALGGQGAILGMFFNTSAEDTTTAKVPQLTVQMGTSNALAEAKLYGAVVEVV